MFLKSSNKNFSYSEKNDSSRSFVVDLNSVHKKEVIENKNFKKKLNSFWEEIFELNFSSKVKSYFFIFLHKLANLFFDAKEPRQIVPTIACQGAVRAKSAYQKGKKIEQIKIGNKVIKNKEIKFNIIKEKTLAKTRYANDLAFFIFLKFLLIFGVKILKNIYKICYKTGWLILFAVRLSFFSFIKFFCLIKNFILKITCLINRFGTKINLVREKIFDNFNNHKSEKEPLKQGKIRYIASAKSRRSVFAFTLVLIILVTPLKALTYHKFFSFEELKGRVLGISENAVDDLLDASQSAMGMNISQAGRSFVSAGENFLKAQQELVEINDLFFYLASLAPNEKMRLASQSKKFLAAGESASRLGMNMSLAFESLFSDKKENMSKAINDLIFYGSLAVEDAKNLDLKLAEINIKKIPEEYQDNFFFLKEKTGSIKTGLSEFIDLARNLENFLGISQDKRYLLVFQNNTELRASGGFIGSFALIDFRNGEIKNIEVPAGGSYDTEGELRELVEAPKPLHLVDPLWHFWDANWWPDWPTTAEKLMWFYERSGGPTVDGVISLTPTVIEKLLGVIGEIDMREKYGITINKDNFWIETQAITEEKLSPAQKEAGQKHEPKRIIGDLMIKIMDELPNRINKEVLANLLLVSESVLGEKHVLFYFNDNGLQEIVKNMGWAGIMKESKWDYLSVINTNIAGGKSDRKIKQEIFHQAEIMLDGTIINTVKIKRIHNAVKREPFCGVRNVNWMRIYVPEGSELLEAGGFRQPADIYFEEPDHGWIKDPLVELTENKCKVHEASGTKIYNENKKTVFANWSMLDPGRETEIYLKYKLPFKIKKKPKQESLASQAKTIINPQKKQILPYALLAQKQPGSLDVEIKSKIKLPINLKIIWKYPKELNIYDGGWQVDKILNKDRYWAVLLESN